MALTNSHPDWVTLRQIAEELNMKVPAIHQRYHVKNWPDGFPAYTGFLPSPTKLYFDKAVVQAIRDQNNQKNNLLKTKVTPPKRSFPPEGWLTVMDIADRLGKTKFKVHQWYCSGQWPEGYSPRNGFLPRTSTLYFDPGVVTGLTRILADSKQEADKAILPPRKYVITASMWTDIGLELIHDGFREAGLHILKKRT